MTITVFHKHQNQVDEFESFPRDSARVFNARILVDGWKLEDVPEWVFHATNAPDSLITDEEQMWFRDQYRAAKLRSVSVGDVVGVDDRIFRCESCGWKEI